MNIGYKHYKTLEHGRKLECINATDKKKKEKGNYENQKTKAKEKPEKKNVEIDKTKNFFTFV